MFGIIVFCVWYLTMGLIVVLLININCRDKILDMMKNMNNLLYHANKEVWLDFIYAMIIVFWAPIICTALFKTAKKKLLKR